MKNIAILSLSLLLLSRCGTNQINEQKEESLTSIKAEKQNGLLMIKSSGSNLLGYQYEKLYPPTGVDSIYGKSGFIHPLLTPHGQVLTRIQPPDHYHHYGIWNPWTHVLFEGDTLDFWNLNKGHGTVRFADFKSITENNDFVEYQAKQEHVVFRESGEVIALNELQTVRVQSVTKDSYIADITIDMTCGTESPFLILEYRYAGFGWRVTEEWHKGNSEVFTSEVKTRNEVDGTTGRWCVVQGELGEDYGGVVMMSHPENFNHPEPLRVWPAGEDNRGDLFANFSPTKNMDWLLEPGKTYTMKYRLLVYNGNMTSEKAEAAWQDFAKATKNEKN